MSLTLPYNFTLHYVSYDYYNPITSPSAHMHTFPTIMIVDQLVGECYYHLENDHFPVKSGDILMINPGVVHEKKLSPGSEIWEVHLAFEDLPMDGLPKNQIVSGDYKLFHLLAPFINQFKKAIDILQTEADFTKPYGNLMAISLFYQLLAIVFRSIDTMTPADSFEKNLILLDNGFSEIVSSLRNFLIQNYMDDISISVVAKRMYISPEYMSRLFKAETGMSPYSFLTEIRMNKAKELLLNTPRTIQEISHLVGYNNAYHFSKLFKKSTAMSPSEFRKTNHKEILS